MDALSLIDLAEEHLRLAHDAPSKRSAHTVFGGHEHVLRQTLIALVGGHALADHESPGDATLQVVRGAVRLVHDATTVEARTGDVVPIPAARHRLDAIEDAVVLLTVALPQ